MPPKKKSRNSKNGSTTYYLEEAAATPNTSTPINPSQFGMLPQRPLENLKYQNIPTYHLNEPHRDQQILQQNQFYQIPQDFEQNRNIHPNTNNNTNSPISFPQQIIGGGWNQTNNHDKQSWYKDPFLMNQQQQRTSSFNPNQIGFVNDGLVDILRASVSLDGLDPDISNAAVILEQLHGQSVDDFNDDEDQDDGLKENKDLRYFIHRDTPNEYYKIKERNSSIRKGQELGNDEEEDRTNLIPSGDDYHDAELPKLEINYSSGDVIFANGNNREKRRLELFEYLSEFYKYKEHNRDKLYQKSFFELKEESKELYKPRSLNIPSEDNTELNELEQDIIEKRDFELSKLKNWRNFQRLENVKTYYNDSLKIYQDANELIDNKLEKLKTFFQRQRNLLVNLDRDFTEISSPRAEKFYSGFNDMQNGVANNENNENNTTITTNGFKNSSSNQSSETEKSSSSSSSPPPSNSIPKRSKRNNPIKKKPTSLKPHLNSHSNSQILSSILEGFAPLLTDYEFKIATGDDLTNSRNPHSNNSKKNPYNSTKESDSDLNSSTGLDSNSNTTTTKKSSRGAGSRAVRDARAIGIVTQSESNASNREHTATLNKIMKQYVSPNDLTNDEVETDLKYLRKMLK